jgi:hypothetical protein
MHVMRNRVKKDKPMVTRQDRQGTSAHRVYVSASFASPGMKGGKEKKKRGAVSRKGTVYNTVAVRSALLYRLPPIHHGFLYYFTCHSWQIILMRYPRHAGWNALCVRLVAVMALCDIFRVFTKEWETIKTCRSAPLFSFSAFAAYALSAWGHVSSSHTFWRVGHMNHMLSLFAACVFMPFS